MTLKFKNNDGDLNIKLTRNNITFLFLLFAPIYAMLLNLSVSMSTVKAEAANCQTEINEIKSFNDCVQNAISTEHGKNVYFYENKFTYRGTKQKSYLD